MMYNKSVKIRRYSLQLRLLPVAIPLIFLSCSSKQQVALDGDYDPSTDSLLSSLPTLQPETQNVSKFDFFKAEILRAIHHRGASNYKFVRKFLDKFVTNGTTWPKSTNPSLNAFLEGNIPTNLGEILTANSQKLLNLYDTLRSNCEYLANGRNFSKIFKNSNVSQNRLGYNWGSKQFSNPVVPSEYKSRPNICQQSFFGLDCSGFVYQAFLLSGLNFGQHPENFANAAYFANPSHYSKVLNTYFGCSKCYNVQRINNALVQDLRSGDIIVLENKTTQAIYHIGFCFRKTDFRTGADSLKFMESRGNPSQDCKFNVSDKGPLETLLIEDRLKTLKFHIVRITAN